MTFFSDGVFAVIITILVLDLRPPHDSAISSLFALWPTLLSYAMSYVLIAIVWINHHHLLRFADVVTPALLWSNFAHLFAVSLLPFTTQWMAESRMDAWPVATYATVFALIDLSFILVCRELFRQDKELASFPLVARQEMTSRTCLTLVAFGVAAPIALCSQPASLAIVIVCMAIYLKPSRAIDVRSK